MGVFGVDQKERKQDLGSVGRAPTERHEQRQTDTWCTCSGRAPTERHEQTHTDTWCTGIAPTERHAQTHTETDRHRQTQTDTDRHMPCSFEARDAADDFNVWGVRVASQIQYLHLQ